MKTWLGCIVLAYRHAPNRILVLENKQTGNITPPSGAIEGSESLRQAAARELKEELEWNINPDEFQVTPIKQEFIYGPQKKERAGDRGINQVVLLNADDLPEPQETDVTRNAVWLNLEEATDKISFDDLRNVIEQASKLLYFHQSAKTLSGNNLSKIGIGSYGIGGRGHRDVELTESQDDSVYIDALVYVFQRGLNFTEISLGYGHGQSLNLFKQALDKSGLNRKDLFITHSLYPRDLESLKNITDDLDTFYKVMLTDYADSTLVTQSLILKFGKKSIYKMLQDLLSSGKSRFVSLSNASPEMIKEFEEVFKSKFFAHEGHLSFEVRALQDKGVFELCNQLRVENIIWRPLGRGKTLGRGWDLLIELSTKYQKTQSQIILNWICHLNYRPMVFSTHKEHIDENISAIDFTMSDEDYQRLTEYRPTNSQSLQIDWEGRKIDDDLVSLINNFS